MNSDDYYNQLNFWNYIRTAINTILLYHKIDSYANIMCNLKVPLLNWLLTNILVPFNIGNFINMENLVTLLLILQIIIKIKIFLLKIIKKK